MAIPSSSRKTQADVAVGDPTGRDNRIALGNGLGGYGHRAIESGSRARPDTTITLDYPPRKLGHRRAACGVLRKIAARDSLLPHSNAACHTVVGSLGRDLLSWTLRLLHRRARKLGGRLTCHGASIGCALARPCHRRRPEKFGFHGRTTTTGCVFLLVIHVGGATV